MSQSQDKTTMSGHRPTAPVIGDLRGCELALKSVPKIVFLHVSKLHPDTTAEQVASYLKPKCSEVVCLKLQSRFPEHYASFKVGVKEESVGEVLTPSCWPSGTLINRFFHQRKRQFLAK